MALSSSSLFHFTKGGPEVLKSILLNGFRVSYCEEAPLSAYIDHRESEAGPYLTKPSIMGGGAPFSTTIMVPMICFCDIPLSNIKDHVKKYGKYAIGVEKKWGIKHKLNPVFYIARNSLIAGAIQTDSKQTERNYSKQLNFQQPYQFDLNLFDYDSDNDEIIDHLGKVYTLNNLYLKPLGEYDYSYEDQAVVLKYYQDEKEWRYIPPRPYLTVINHRHSNSNHVQLNPWRDLFVSSYWKHRKFYPNVPFSIEDITRHDEEVKQPKFSPYSNLPFSLEEITFIIVEKESEIANLSKFLLSEFADKPGIFSVLTKLISFERMEQDIFI